VLLAPGTRPNSVTPNSSSSNGRFKGGPSFSSSATSPPLVVAHASPSASFGFVHADLKIAPVAVAVPAASPSHACGGGPRGDDDDDDDDGRLRPAASPSSRLMQQAAEEARLRDLRVDRVLQALNSGGTGSDSAAAASPRTASETTIASLSTTPPPGAQPLLRLP
jgi:hypothetical protein